MEAYAEIGPDRFERQTIKDHVVFFVLGTVLLVGALLFPKAIIYLLIIWTMIGIIAVYKIDDSIMLGEHFLLFEEYQNEYKYRVDNYRKAAVDYFKRIHPKTSTFASNRISSTKRHLRTTKIKMLGEFFKAAFLLPVTIITLIGIFTYAKLHFHGDYEWLAIVINALYSLIVWTALTYFLVNGGN